MTTLEYTIDPITFSATVTPEEARYLTEMIIGLLTAVKSNLALRGKLPVTEMFPTGTTLDFVDTSTTPETIVQSYDVNQLQSLNILQTVQSDFAGKRVDKLVLTVPL